MDLRCWSRKPDAFDAIRNLGFSRIVSTDLEPVVSGAACVVLCTPVESMAVLAERILPWLDPEAVVTDAGSVKASVVDALQPLLGGRFIGAHPIAGSDRTGIDAARADLYSGATCVLTPTATTLPAAIRVARELWESVGCQVEEMSPFEHDAMLARTSHLPHVVASALTSAVARNGDRWEAFIGGGFRDTTRIAASNSDLWTGILLANSIETGRSIAQMQKILQEFASALESGDAEALRRLLSDSRTARLRLNKDLDGI